MIAFPALTDDQIDAILHYADGSYMAYQTQPFEANTMPDVFKRNCVSCHNITVDCNRFVHVVARWDDEVKLKSFIRDSQKMINSGDLYANPLFISWNKTIMPAFPNITDAEMDSIINYLR